MPSKEVEMIRGEKASSPKLKEETYDQHISEAMAARNTQKRDTDPMIQKEGYLCVEDLDRLRRRKLLTTV